MTDLENKIYDIITCSLSNEPQCWKEEEGRLVLHNQFLLRGVWIYASCPNMFYVYYNFNDNSHSMKLYSSTLFLGWFDRKRVKLYKTVRKIIDEKPKSPAYFDDIVEEELQRLGEKYNCFKSPQQMEKKNDL